MPVKILPHHNVADLTPTERSQLERKELARGAWREGQVQNALVILESVASEQMTPRVAGEVLVTKAACLCALNDFEGALDVLRAAAPFIDTCDARVNGSFYFHRALVRRNLGDTDAALMDYAGSLAYWQDAGEADYEIAALINLAELYFLSDDLEQAQHYTDRVFALLTQESTHVCNAYDTKAKILLAKGNLVQAWRAIEHAIKAAGENDNWRQMCLETQHEIKARLLEFMVPVATPADLDQLKIEVIRHALDVSGGSTVKAAKMLNTSHQLVAYTAKTKGLTRKPPPRKSIIKIS